LISKVQADRVNTFVLQARADGAEIFTGGDPVCLDEFPLGCFYAPTILGGVNPNDEIAQEEVFGPILTVQLVDSPEEAFSVANNSRYGLCAGVFTADISRALTIARDLDVGQVYVNDYFVGGPETPFGGVKDSGFGRERGWVALANYCRVKSIGIKL
jgi:acyl-CoA reductase-like NAD-dependent aldehyde dehydrogenase